MTNEHSMLSLKPVSQHPARASQPAREAREETFDGQGGMA